MNGHNVRLSSLLISSFLHNRARWLGYIMLQNIADKFNLVSLSIGCTNVRPGRQTTVGMAMAPTSKWPAIRVSSYQAAAARCACHYASDNWYELEAGEVNSGSTPVLGTVDY